MPLVSGPLAPRAGTALTWKAFQLAGTKGMFLVRTVILARLLSPDDFGLLAIATIAVGFLVSITDLGMTAALIHQSDVEETHYDSAWTANMVRALCVSGVLLAAAPVIAVLFDEPRAVPILRLLALKPLIDASASIKVAGLARSLQYRSMAFVSLPGVAVETLVSVLLALKYGVWALVAGALTGAVAVVVTSYIVAPHRPRFALSIDAVRPLARYGRWVFVTGLVSVSASSLTQVVISRKLGAVELGLYFLAAKLAFLPHEVASQVVGEVAFSLYARLQHDRIRVTKAFRSVFLGMTTFLLPAYVLLIALAPWLVEDFLGDRWKGTEPLIQMLACVCIVGLFGNAISPLFRGLGYPKWTLAIELWQSSVLIFSVWSLTSRYGAAGVPLAWLIAIGSAQPLSFLFARRILQKPLEGSVFRVGLVLLASLAGAMTAIVLHRIVPGVGGFVIAASLAAGVTTVLVWLCDRRFGLGLTADLTHAFPQVANLVGWAPAAR